MFDDVIANNIIVMMILAICPVLFGGFAIGAVFGWYLRDTKKE